MIINSNIEMKKNHSLIGKESNSVKSELSLIARCFFHIKCFAMERIHCFRYFTSSCQHWKKIQKLRDS